MEGEEAEVEDERRGKTASLRDGRKKNEKKRK